MITINPYLSFNGNCEEAFNFYKSIFGGEFAFVGRYKDMPAEHPVAEEDKEKIMHIYYAINEKTSIMGADSSEAFGGKLTFGDNISLSINAQTEDETKRIFDALSEGGKVIMPLAPTFWSPAFGYIADKFGIFWMVSCEHKK